MSVNRQDIQIQTANAMSPSFSSASSSSSHNITEKMILFTVELLRVGLNERHGINPVLMALATARKAMLDANTPLRAFSQVNPFGLNGASASASFAYASQPDSSASPWSTVHSNPSSQASSDPDRFDLPVSALRSDSSGSNGNNVTLNGSLNGVISDHFSPPPMSLVEEAGEVVREVEGGHMLVAESPRVPSDESPSRASAPTPSGSPYSPGAMLSWLFASPAPSPAPSPSAFFNANVASAIPSHTPHSRSQDGSASSQSTDPQNMSLHKRGGISSSLG